MYIPSKFFSINKITSKHGCENILMVRYGVTYILRIGKPG